MYNITGVSKDQKFASILAIIGYLVLLILTVGVAKLSNLAPVQDKCGSGYKKSNGDETKSTKKSYIYASIFVLVEIAALIALFKV